MLRTLHTALLVLLILLSVFQSGSKSLASGTGSGVETSNAYIDALWLMREARDPGRSAAEKSAAAQKGLEFIRGQVGSQLPIQSLDELPAYFAAHPELNQSLSLNSTKGLGRVVTEFNLLLNDIRAGEKLKGCDDGKHGTGVKNGMAGHDPCQGNRNLKTNIYTKIGMNGDKVEYGSPMPAFVNSNVNEILAYSMMTNFFDEKNDGKDPFRPTLEQVKKANPESKEDGEFATSAVLAEVRGQAYKQAIAREIRNRMSLVYQYKKTPGGKSWEEMKGLISSAVKEDCKHCTAAMSLEIEKTVQGALAADLNHKTLKKSEDPALIAEQLCARMKASGFPFKGGSQEQEVRSRYQDRRMSALKGTHDVKFDLQLIGQQEIMELNDIHSKRKAILEKMVLEGGDGLLLLTDAMSELSGTSADETKLKCTDSSKSTDAAIVLAASSEAIGKTKEYAGKLNSILKPGNLSKESQKAELDELLKIAPGAVGEALNYSHPFAASLVCNSLKRLKREDDIQALQDGAVMWGATVVGVVAIIASSGAATPFVAATGMAVSAAAGLGAAAYSWDQSGDAEKLALEYRDAAIAQGVDPDLLNLSKEEFLRFKEQRFNAVLSGAFSAVEFAGLIAAGAKAGKNMAEINQEIERIIANPKEKGNWFKQNAKALAADAAINTAISSAANGYITGDFTPDPAQIAMGMVIGAGVRRLGKAVTPEESAMVRDRMVSLRNEMKRSLSRDPTPDELVAAYSKINLEPVEIVAPKPMENPDAFPPKDTEGTRYSNGKVTTDEDGSWYLGYDKITATDASGKDIGFVSYKIDEETKTLTIGWSRVDEAYRGQGYQNKLFQRMFEENPSINAVRTSLDDVNQSAFTERLAALVKKQEGYVRPEVSGVDQKVIDRLTKKGKLNEKELNECCSKYLGDLYKSDPKRFEALMDEALKGTPAWRTREKFGFTEFGEMKNYNFSKGKDGTIDFRIEFDAVKPKQGAPSGGIKGSEGNPGGMGQPLSASATAREKARSLENRLLVRDSKTQDFEDPTFLSMRDGVQRSLQGFDEFLWAGEGMTNSPADFRKAYSKAMDEAHVQSNYTKNGKEYSSKPGQKRDDVDESFSSTEFRAKEYAEKVAQQFDLGEVRTGKLQIEGIPEDAAPRNRSLHIYPPGKHLNVYFDQAADHLFQAKKMISEGKALEAQKEIGRYYHVMVNARPYDQINNSVFMNQTNYLLRLTGHPGIPQGELDHLFMRLNSKQVDQIWPQVLEGKVPSASGYGLKPKPKKSVGD